MDKHTIPECGNDNGISIERIDHLVETACAAAALEGHEFTEAERDEVRAGLMAKLADGIPA